MSLDKVNCEHLAKQDTTCSELISYSESQIEEWQQKIRDFIKSIVFFKKQESSGVPFPAKRAGIQSRHKEITSDVYALICVNCIIQFYCRFIFL